MAAKVEEEVDGGQGGKVEGEVEVEVETDGGQGGKVERECIGISWRLLLTIIWLSDAQSA